MAVERRDYVALEWVAGEIAETLKQSIAELDAYLDNRADVTRLRFCLTYIHQVYGTLKMVEFAGAALLAEEMEAVAQALVGATVVEAQREDALLALKTALDSLPNYLQRLLVHRRDAPALLLPLINDLRAVRGEVLITESAVFSPDLTAKIDAAAQPLDMSAGELSEIAKKLRQMYQMALLNYLRNNDPRQNLNYLAKVCARLGKLASGRPSEALWKICIALCEGLLNRSIQPSAAVKLLLRQVDSQLKILVEQGEAALQAEPPLGLIKNLLYYVAASGANSRYIGEIKQAYNLPNALPPESEVIAAAGDDEATGAVKAALAQQLANLAHDIPRLVVEKGPAGKNLIAAIKRVQDTAALLGMTRAQAVLQDLVQRVLSDRLDVDAAVRSLHQLAETFELEQRPSAPKPLFNDSEEAQEQLDKAFDAVMRESRNSLEQAKEAIIEFVATQWRHQCLEDVPELLAGVRGSFAVAGLHRAAAVLASCENYVRRDLLEQKKIPAWQLLDTLADAIASVDYYVERLSEDAAAECESILDIAEESVAALSAPAADTSSVEPFSAGQSAIPRSTDDATETRVSAQVIPFQRPGAAVEDDSERYGEDSVAFPEEEEDRAEHSQQPAAERIDAADVSDRAEEFEIARAELAQEEAVQAQVAPAAEIPAAAESNDEDAPDPEIVEIFIEEAAEVLDTIAEHFPQWREQPTDEETLSTIRRAFHTLKGSGRMVGAVEIGELAWSIENMLNRVMDGTLHIDAARLDAAAEAAQLLPAMVEAFQQRRANNTAPIEALKERAQLLAKEQTPAPSFAPATLSVEEPVEKESFEERIQEEAGEYIGEQQAPELTASSAADHYEFEELAPHLEPEVQQFAIHDQSIGEQPGSESLHEQLREEADAEADEDDNVLLDIFIAEAAAHVQVVDDFVRYADQLAGPAELSDDLQRALHTLKGSAHMAEVAGIAKVVTPVEHLVKELRAAQLKADPDVMAVLQQSVQMIRAGLAESDVRHYQVANADDFVQDVDALRYSRLALIDTETEQAGDGISPAAVSQFLGDAIELISGVGDDIRSWRDRRLDDQRQHTLAATISQVADSAEALNLAPVVDLAQALQTLLRVGADTPMLDDSFFALAGTAAERLIDMLDRLAANQRPDVDGELLTALQEYEFDVIALDEDLATAKPNDFIEPELDDAVLATPGLLDSQLIDIPVLQDVVEPAPLTLTDHLDREPAAPIAALFDEYFEEPADAADAATDNIEHTPATAYSLIDEHLEGDEEQALDTQSQHGEFELAAEFVAVQPQEEEAAAEQQPIAELSEEQNFAAEVSVQENRFEPSEVEIAALDEVPQIDEASFADGEVVADSDSDLDQPVEDVAEQTPETAQDLDYAYAVVQAAHDVKEGAWTEPEQSIEAASAADNFTVEAPETALASGDDDEEIDTEILEIFIEEAGDLLEAIDEAILHWGNDRDNSIYLDDLQRLLHTLKGGARLAGLKNLGNLSHNFETLLINSQQQGRAVDDELLAEVQAYQDQLIRLVDVVKQHGHRGDQMVADTAAAAVQMASEDELPPIAEVEFDATAESPTTVAEAIDGDEAEYVPAQRDAEHVAKDDAAAAKVLAFARPKPAAEPFTAPTLRQPDNLRETESLPEMGGVQQQLRRGPQEVVKISAQLLEQLVNLAGETSIARGRAEEQVNEFVFSLDEMQITVDRLHEQVRRLDLETEAQMLFRQEQVESEGLEGFDPLEFDRYSLLQQLSRSLLESASDLVDIKNTLAEKSRDMETLLVQQSRINTELQEGLMRSRMVPFARMVPRLRRIVRQVAGELEKQVEFYVDNAEGELDRTVLERIVAPLEHMLRNALDHGIESAAERAAASKPEQGTIVLSVTREGGDVVLTLTDDGRGIDLNAVRAKAISRGLMEAGANLSDHEVMQFILQSGFSTAKQVTQISGRGVGMDVVYSEIKQLGGNLEIDSAWGKGTRFIVRLPFTVSVNRALMVAGCGDVYAIPLNTIEGIVRVSPFELEAYYQPDAPLFEYAGQSYLMRYIGALLRTGDKPNLEGHTTPLPVLLVRGSDHAVAIQVDSLMGSREIVVKTLGPQFGLVQGLSGATVLGDGSVVVILDLMAMIRADASHLHRDLMLGQEEVHADRDRPLLVMVVDDSVTVRKVTSRFLERQGMEVILAKDGIDAINLLQDSDRIPDVMLLDIEMPRMDGFEVASRIRHTSRLRDLPIIMITSRTGDKHRDRATALGVNKYLGKPYQETLLLDTIHELTGTVIPE